MTRQLTLGVKLTLIIALFVIIQSIVIMAVFINYFSPAMKEQAFDIVKRGAVSSAAVYAHKWNYDIQIASANPDDQVALLKKLKKEMGKEKSVVAIGVYGVKESAASKKKYDAKKDFTKLAVWSRDKSFSLSNTLHQQVNVNKKEAQVLNDDYLVAGSPVMMEDITIGYVLYVESIKTYNTYQGRLVGWMVAMFLIGLVFVMVGVLVLGRSTARPITRIAKTAARIADGDLSNIGEVEKGVAETSTLSQAVQDMAKAFREQVNTIKTMTSEASDVSRNVAKAMAQLAFSASEQASAVAETAATVEEMEKTGVGVASNANQIVEAAEKSAEGSNRGRQAVDTASGIIFNIKEDSQEISARSKMLLNNVEEIGNIINSVNAISEQSKILAVNASIEAAKAGEFGSGFAVVAQEVKDLAGQSKEATEQITRTLTSIRQAIEGMVDLAENGEIRTVEGVSAVANAGAIVNDLSEAIRESSDVANVIDTSVKQQSLGLSQIASAIEEINASAAENQDITREIESSTQKMAVSLEDLSGMVEYWKTKE